MVYGICVGKGTTCERKWPVPCILEGEG